MGLKGLKDLKKEFFARDTVKVAKDLLGKILIHKNTAGMIVETEAYKGYPDEASHAAKRTPRSAIMFDSYGKFYIYFIYGNYFCLNITAERGKPGAVLIRALQPLIGINTMKRRRKTNSTDNLTNLTNGPGKLCQAMGITKALNGTNINNKMKILDNKSLTLTKSDIVQTTRIGIEKAQHLKWRFYIKENPFVSKK